MEETQTLPDWLAPPVEVPKFPRTRDERELEQMTFDAVFERVIEALEAGESASSVIKKDPRDINLGRFMAWVRRDKDRLSRFDEAEQNGTRIIEDSLMDIATGVNSDVPEDVQRSKLRVDTLWKILQVRNRKRYGNDAEKNTGFSGGITVVLGDVQSPYVKRDPLVIEHNG